MPLPFRDLTNMRFGRLTVRWPAGLKGSHVYWLCSCDCGKLKVICGYSLRNGDTTSCGCYRKEVTVSRNRKGLWTTHGHSRGKGRTPEYIAWDCMIQRCTNPKHPNWKRYGGRGIKVCRRWMRFENFLADMGRRPQPHLSIDRRNNEKGYFKSNCRWATRKEQMNNTRLTNAARNRKAKRGCGNQV
jgi:hypothetical protein